MKQYKPGDKVKIISMDKVRSYPKDDGGYWINNWYWNNAMDQYAGTIQKISKIILDCPVAYSLEGSKFSFTNAMIEGPAEEKAVNPGINLVELQEKFDALLSEPDIADQFWAFVESRKKDTTPADPVEQEGEGQEEKKWTDEDMIAFLDMVDDCDRAFTNEELLNQFTITSKK